MTSTDFGNRGFIFSVRFKEFMEKKPRLLRKKNMKLVNFKPFCDVRQMQGYTFTIQIIIQNKLLR